MIPEQIHNDALTHLANMKGTIPDILIAEAKRDTEDAVRIKAQLAAMERIINYYYQLGKKQGLKEQKSKGE